ncbi:MAG: heme-binding domain-containing protein [Bacteroidota bacterium]|nr:heme-binding domain-containing protein [Bacteroidota bacterium]
MKKRISVSFIANVFCFSFLIIGPVAAQSATENENGSKPLPEAIVRIVQKSCISCHSEHGNFKATLHLNFTKWNKYPAVKQSAKANNMCKVLSKGVMPPKKMRKAHPERIPTEQEVKMICDWAQSLQVSKN